MASEQHEFRPLGTSELNRISAGRICDLGGTRMEASVQLGDKTMVIWASTGSHGDGVGCVQVYWK